jgi:hypothetical protein
MQRPVPQAPVASPSQYKPEGQDVGSSQSQVWLHTPPFGVAWQSPEAQSLSLEQDSPSAAPSSLGGSHCPVDVLQTSDPGQSEEVRHPEPEDPPPLQSGSPLEPSVTHCRMPPTSTQLAEPHSASLLQFLPQ